MASCHLIQETWRYGCPKSPDWESDVDSWTESEGISSSELCERNDESLLCILLGKTGAAKKISFLLEDWELARVAWSCHIALAMLCQEMSEAW